MANKIKVDFWGNETTIYNWKEGSKNNNKIVSSMHENYKSEKVSPSIYEKYALPTLKELEKNQDKEIDLNTFKIIRFGYLLLRMHGVPGNEKYEDMLEKILDKKRFESEDFEKIATEVKLANLVDHLNQKDRDDMKEFISNSDKITERNVKHSENISASKDLRDPYFINAFLSYVDSFMSFFDIEKTKLKQDIKPVRFFSNNEKEIEDKAISKAKKSGDIVDRPIKDVGITSSKKNNIFDDLFNSFLNVFVKSKDKSPIELDVKNQHSNLFEKPKTNDAEIATTSVAISSTKGNNNEASAEYPQWNTGSIEEGVGGLNSGAKTDAPYRIIKKKALHTAVNEHYDEPAAYEHEMEYYNQEAGISAANLDEVQLKFIKDKMNPPIGKYTTAHIPEAKEDVSIELPKSITKDLNKEENEEVSLSKPQLNKR